jgi:hypothetical protein
MSETASEKQPRLRQRAIKQQKTRYFERVGWSSVEAERVEIYLILLPVGQFGTR